MARRRRAVVQKKRGSLNLVITCERGALGYELRVTVCGFISLCVCVCVCMCVSASIYMDI